MATVQSRTRPVRLPLPRRRRALRIALGALALLLAALAWFWTPIAGYAQTGASYGARLGCACRYVSGRPLQECRADFEDGMGLVTLSDDPPQRTVTARFPLLARQSAQYRAGEGCVLEPWRD
jgi:hypothetical protein